MFNIFFIHLQKKRWHSNKNKYHNSHEQYSVTLDSRVSKELFTITVLSSSFVEVCESKMGSRDLSNGEVHGGTEAFKDGVVTFVGSR